MSSLFTNQVQALYWYRENPKASVNREMHTACSHKLSLPLWLCDVTKSSHHSQPCPELHLDPPSNLAAFWFLFNKIYHTTFDPSWSGQPIRREAETLPSCDWLTNLLLLQLRREAWEIYCYQSTLPINQRTGIKYGTFNILTRAHAALHCAWDKWTLPHQCFSHGPLPPDKTLHITAVDWKMSSQPVRHFQHDDSSVQHKRENSLPTSLSNKAESFHKREIIHVVYQKLKWCQ